MAGEPVRDEGVFLDQTFGAAGFKYCLRLRVDNNDCSISRENSMIGCAGMIALVTLLFGALLSLAIPNATPAERISTAFMPSALSFIAAIILFRRDRVSRRGQEIRLRRQLLNRRDVGESEYLTYFPNIEPALMSQIRHAIAEFVQVPVEKIHATDRLREDLMADSIEPGLYYFVINRVIALQQHEITPSQIITINATSLSSAGDLAIEVQRLTDVKSNR